MPQIVTILLSLTLVLLIRNTVQLQQINIGGIFFDTEHELEEAFESAVKRVNSENYLNFKLLPLKRHVSVTDGSIGLQRQACDLIENGVAAIFGPSSQAESDIVALICNSTGIPHIQFDSGKEESIAEKANYQMSVNVFPSQVVLSKAYADIVQNFGWKKFTIVYNADDSQAETRMQDLLQLRDVHKEIVRVRKFHQGDDYRIMWKSIKGERRVVLDCEPELLLEVLNASKHFDLNSNYNHLFLTNLNSHNGNLKSLKFDRTFQVNVSAARLQLNGKLYKSYEFTQQTRSIQLDLVWDAVSVFANAIQNISHAYQIHKPRVHCEFGEFSHAQSWSMGRYINHVMKEISGVNSSDYRSSHLQFDDEGQRINFNIEIYQPIRNYPTAIWNTKGHIERLNVEEIVEEKIRYKVSTRIGEPYFMVKPDADELQLENNERYHGYAVDLIEALSKEVGFEYDFKPVPDNNYGSYVKETKQWNGIIGELMNNDAHMGICDLTITQARRTVVDFTVPFMQLGIGILGYTEPPQPKHVLAFLEPFAGKVWIYVMIAIFIISFLFLFVARYSKAEWDNPHPCNKDPDTLENMWNLGNCLYLTVASIMTAGCDILPKSASMRTFTAMWWIFAIIIANSYTANLAAFLTNSKRDGSISDLKDLVEQTKTKFGTMEGGSTKTFFSESNETVYRLAYNIMNNDDPSAYTKDNSEGVDRVSKSEGKYMFLMETTGIEYNRERFCELRMVGEKFGDKHYAIAVPFGAEYRSNLSVGILKLSERGELFRLKDKWWKNTNVTCPKERETGDTPDMAFEDVRGIFYTLFIGVSIAFMLGISEFVVHAQRIASEEKMTFKEAFKREIKFVMSVWNNRKPITSTPTASVHSSSRRSSETKTVKSLKRQSAAAGDSAELREIRRTSKSNSNCVKREAKL